METRFTSFVILGAMRTGSNFLEASLSELEGVKCYGEVFNPAFIGQLGGEELFGMSLSAREAEPLTLLRRLRERTDGLPGFRFFSGHDPRVLDTVLADRACAKIVLSRHPLDSYVSLKIARETGQWKVGRGKTPRTARVAFDAREFAEFLADQDAFYGQVRRALRLSGQTPFEVSYDDLADVAVLNGLAAWLGVPGRLSAPSGRLQRQNPAPVGDKLVNPEAVAPAIAALDPWRLLDRAGSAEPDRKAAVRTYVAAPRSALLHLPLPGGPVERINAWLAALDGAPQEALRRDFGWRSLQDWRAAAPGHRSFTVLRHPLARAHATFAARLLLPGPACYGHIRAQLARDYWFEFPDGPPGAGYGADRHRTLFLQFLNFVRANLAGLTSIRVDGAWASQEAVVQGFARRLVPDRLIREDRLSEGLAELAAEIGREAPHVPTGDDDPSPVPLRAIYDAEVESAARAAYGRDYLAFGFGDWRDAAAPVTLP